MGASLKARMSSEPVYQWWMQPDRFEPQFLKTLLRPYPAEDMACVRVSKLVNKSVKNGRTISEITLLDKKARVTELARMLGGQTDAACKHAEALLK